MYFENRRLSGFVKLTLSVDESQLNTEGMTDEEIESLYASIEERLGVFVLTASSFISGVLHSGGPVILLLNLIIAFFYKAGLIAREAVIKVGEGTHPSFIVWHLRNFGCHSLNIPSWQGREESNPRWLFWREL
jgi:hypothetical protein